MGTLDPYQQTCITILVAFLGLLFIIVLLVTGIGVWTFIDALLDERKLRKDKLKEKTMKGDIK